LLSHCGIRIADLKRHGADAEYSTASLARDKPLSRTCKGEGGPRHKRILGDWVDIH
jgi:hypothetical protein